MPRARLDGRVFAHARCRQDEAFVRGQVLKGCLESCAGSTSRQPQATAQRGVGRTSMLALGAAGLEVRSCISRSTTWRGHSRAMVDDKPARSIRAASSHRRGGANSVTKLAALPAGCAVAAARDGLCSDCASTVFGCGPRSSVMLSAASASYTDSAAKPKNNAFGTASNAGAAA